MDKKKEELIENLQTLSHEELREVLCEVFKTLRPNPEEDKYNRNCFFLGTASIYNESSDDEKEHWGKPNIQAVAYIDQSISPVGLEPNWGFCQSGTCECGVEVRSNYKEGVCPICSAKVYMT